MTKQFKTFVTLCALLCAFYGQSQERYQYSIGIDEIQSAEATKESDNILRPMFDVPAIFNEDSKLLVFKTSARIEESSLIEKLEKSGFHLNSFSKINVE